MKLLRYREIQRMLYVRTRKDPPTVPNGYGAGAWHAVIADLFAEIEPAKLKGMQITIGPKRFQKKIDLVDLVDGDPDDPGPEHPRSEFTQEEFRTLAKKLLAMMKEPEAEAPEVSAAEKMADKAQKDLEAANRQIAELQAEVDRRRAGDTTIN